MNPAESVLEGRTAYVPGHEPVSRLIRQHLLRMGASLVDGAATADIAVAAESDVELGSAGGIVCTLEDLVLDNGALVASETTAQAAMGLPEFIGASGGRPDRTGVDIASSAAAFLAVATICAALNSGQSGPTRFSTSALRALAMLKSLCFAGRSRPDEWVGTHVLSREKAEDAGYKTADLNITLDFSEGNQAGWRSYCEFLGLRSAFIDENAETYMQTVGWGDRVDAARPFYEERMQTLPSSEAMAMIVEHGGSSVPFLNVEDCLAHPQAAAVGLDTSFYDGLPFHVETRGDAPVAPRASSGAGLPLAGVRVLDLGIGGVGPFAPMILGRLGADVVKVEPPFDFVHTIGPWTAGLSGVYLACNTAKRSISLNLKEGSDRDAFLKLVADADVVNANFRPGALDRLGVGFEDLLAVNPNIILASTTGYGWAGPMASQPCTDPHTQAFAGFAALNSRPAGAGPRRCRYMGFIDVVTSTVIAEGICAALLVRDANGGGVHTQTSMMHAICEAAQTTLDEHPPMAPDDIYRAADGYFALTCRSEADWQVLLAALGDPPAELLEERFASTAGRHDNRDELRDLLETRLVKKAALGWVLELARAGIPAVRVIDDDEALARIDYRRDGIVSELSFGDGAPILVGGDHAVFDDLDVAELFAPTPGEHESNFRADPSSFWADR